jgi:hypothetical protein
LSGPELWKDRQEGVRTAYEGVGIDGVALAIAAEVAANHAKCVAKGCESVFICIEGEGGVIFGYPFAVDPRVPRADAEKRALAAAEEQHIQFGRPALVKPPFVV